MIMHIADKAYKQNDDAIFNMNYENLKDEIKLYIFFF